MRVLIQKLAPTGEGIVRDTGGVGFVAGALAGEDVEAQVEERRKNFWKGRAVKVFRASAARVAGPHADCPGCDWAHFDPTVALESKRDLFLETMERLGGQSPPSLGRVDAEPSPIRYRLRNRFHVSGTGQDVVIGHFERRTHRVRPLTDCDAVSTATIALLPRIREAIQESGLAVHALDLLESLDGTHRVSRIALDASDRLSARRLGARLEPLLEGVRIEILGGDSGWESGAEFLMLTVGGRPFPVSVETFFQANRYLVGRLYEDVRNFARGVRPGSALDAFGGAGLFAGVLLDGGHDVTTVEGDRSAMRDAERARSMWDDGSKWTIVRSDVASFTARPDRVFDLAVLDPPRAGLGMDLSVLLARRVSARIVYVSCEPATLARDLRVLRGSGFRITHVRLYDLFAGTHRIEAVVVLDREARA